MDRYLIKKYKDFKQVPFEYLFAELLIEENSSEGRALKRHCKATLGLKTLPKVLTLGLFIVLLLPQFE